MKKILSLDAPIALLAFFVNATILGGAAILQFVQGDPMIFPAGMYYVLAGTLVLCIVNIARVLLKQRRAQRANERIFYRASDNPFWRVQSKPPR